MEGLGLSIESIAAFLRMDARANAFQLARSSVRPVVAKSLQRRFHHCVQRKHHIGDFVVGRVPLLDLFRQKTEPIGQVIRSSDPPRSQRCRNLVKLMCVV